MLIMGTKCSVKHKMQKNYISSFSEIKSNRTPNLYLLLLARRTVAAILSPLSLSLFGPRKTAVYLEP